MRAGVTGPAGHNILPSAAVRACGNFSGIWLDGQVSAVETLWTHFLSELKAGGGTVSEVVMDTERSAVMEFIWANVNTSAHAPDCARMRLGAIQAVREAILFSSVIG